jgi:hypothetical protein
VKQLKDQVFAILLGNEAAPLPAVTEEPQASALPTAAPAEFSLSPLHV